MPLLPEDGGVEIDYVSGALAKGPLLGHPDVERAFTGDAGGWGLWRAATNRGA